MSDKKYEIHDHNNGRILYTYDEDVAHDTAKRIKEYGGEHGATVWSVVNNIRTKLKSYLNKKNNNNKHLHEGVLQEGKIGRFSVFKLGDGQSILHHNTNDPQEAHTKASWLSRTLQHPMFVVDNHSGHTTKHEGGQGQLPINRSGRTLHEKEGGNYKRHWSQTKSKNKKKKMIKEEKITHTGFKAVKQELDHLKGVELPAVQQAVATSKGVERKSAKERHNWIQGRIGELEGLHKNLKVTSPPKDGTIGFGSKVTIKGEDGAVGKYHIVGQHEADFAKGRISHTSPLAKALIGRRVDDQISVDTPSGGRHYRILKEEQAMIKTPKIHNVYEAYAKIYKEGVLAEEKKPIVKEAFIKRQVIRLPDLSHERHKQEAKASGVAARTLASYGKEKDARRHIATSIAHWDAAKNAPKMKTVNEIVAKYDGLKEGLSPRAKYALKIGGINAATGAGVVSFVAPPGTKLVGAAAGAIAGAATGTPIGYLHHWGLEKMGALPRSNAFWDKKPKKLKEGWRKVAYPVVGAAGGAVAGTIGLGALGAAVSGGNPAVTAGFAARGTVVGGLVGGLKGYMKADDIEYNLRHNKRDHPKGQTGFFRDTKGNRYDGTVVGHRGKYIHAQIPQGAVLRTKTFINDAPKKRK